MRLRDFQQDFKNKFRIKVRKAPHLLEQLVTDFYEQVDSPFLKENLREALSRALEKVRSFSKNLNFRVRQLSPRNIELVLPRRDRLMEGQQETEKQYSEGVLITVGIEAGRLLWQRNAPKTAKGFFVHSVNWKLLKFIESEAIFRMELSEVARETALAELAKNIGNSIENNQKTNLELQGQYYDHNDQLCGEITLEIYLTAYKLLDWK